ncbi:hypothetical protein BR93DRAFT_926055 [Coniochaeta sp. PMI_546]|nr:hypothetical protein BR93DRAFT_926055 [Coniochaeta sp. PMI_546]
MFKQGAVLFAAVALFVTSTLAGEAVHLANCGSDTGSFIRSALFYYSDDSQSNSGNPPPSQNAANANGNGALVTWEGQAISGKFATGETFTSHIQAGAGGFAVGQFAGTGNNNERQFVCFRDNNRQLFRTTPANACFSIYYCLDA